MFCSLGQLTTHTVSLRGNPFFLRNIKQTFFHQTHVFGVFFVRKENDRYQDKERKVNVVVPFDSSVKLVLNFREYRPQRSGSENDKKQHKNRRKKQNFHRTTFKKLSHLRGKIRKTFLSLTSHQHPISGQTCFFSREKKTESGKEVIVKTVLI